MTEQLKRCIELYWPNDHSRFISIDGFPKAFIVSSGGHQHTENLTPLERDDMIAHAELFWRRKAEALENEARKQYPDPLFMDNERKMTFSRSRECMTATQAWALAGMEGEEKR